ncbi:hypothetical protein J3458_015150 [Metarhizium acridum]|uniref:uncharacterized protein n=1 Tax=Metarhizium acridum TaxID=92637 RepID=UPI001C6AB6F8|nr:hypothetical protein J3458_015150 [Metarhizium acridum]
MSGKTNWTITHEPCDLSPFHQDVVFQVASSCVITIVFVSDSHPATGLGDCLSVKSNHVTILTLAWAYILSARWAELIPGARLPTYNHHQDQSNAANKLRRLEDDSSPVVVDVGDVDEDAAWWWTVVLSTEDGWKASMKSNTGFHIYALWAIRI